MRRAIGVGLVAVAFLIGGMRVAAGLTAATSPSSASRQGVATSVRVDPLRASLSLTLLRTPAGRVEVASARVVNHGPVALSTVAAAIVAPPSVSVLPALSLNLGRLGPGSATTALWILCARAAGSYRISVKVTGRDAAGNAYVAYSQPSQLVVTQGSPIC